MTLHIQEIRKRGFHRLIIARNPDVGYVGAIAVHDVSRGPALGGTRLMRYASDVDALADAMLLAQNMTLKSAFAGLPFGGGKAAIVEPSGPYDRAALLHAHGCA